MVPASRAAIGMGLRGSIRSKVIAGIFRGSTLLGALAVIALLVALFCVLVAQSWPVWSQYGVLPFVFGDTWAPNYVDPVTNQTVVRLGALPMIVGTVLSSLIGLVVAAPIGILVAIFLVEFAPRRLSTVLTFVVELI